MSTHPGGRIGGHGARRRASLTPLVLRSLHGPGPTTHPVPVRSPSRWIRWLIPWLQVVLVGSRLWWLAPRVWIAVGAPTG